MIQPAVQGSPHLKWTTAEPWFSFPSTLKPALQDTRETQHWKVFSLCLLLFGLVFWVFLPSLRGHFIEFDDSPYVTENTHIQLTPGNLVWALSHEVAANWHPVTQWSLMLDHQFYGFNPWGYHLTNVLLHAINTILAFLVLRRMTGTTWQSLMVAVLFGLHPLRVESVAWISERKDVLCVLFWMLTLWAYAGYAQIVTRENCRAMEIQLLSSARFLSGATRRASLFYTLALLFFSLALMSKPMAVTLPGVLLLLDFWPLARWRYKRWAVLAAEKVPFLLLSAGSCVITYIFQRNSGMMEQLVGVSLPFSVRLENAAVSYARYLGKLFWPAELCAFYPHPGHWPLTEVLLALSLVLGLSALTFSLRHKLPWLFVGWFWFFGTLVPVIGLIQVGAQSMADRYSYIPSLGIFIIGVWLFHRLTETWHYRNFVGGFAGGALFLVCVMLTRHQIGFWQNEVSVWQRAVAVTGNNYDAHNRLGSALLVQGNVAEAVREFQEASRLNPAFAEPWYSQGYIFISQGNFDKAIACYQKALEAQPDSIVAHMSLGNLLLRAGRVDEALLNLREAARLDPHLAAAEDSLGQAFALKESWDEAIACYQKAIELQPDSAATWNDLGLAFSRAGRFEDALASFQKAVARQPGNAAARNNLGYVLLHMRRVDEAVPQFLAALKVQPDNAETHNNLGGALLAKGQAEAAISEFQEALRLKPDYEAASRNLAFVLKKRQNSAALPTNSATP